ncbi:MAG: leucyl aminopeptidase [Dehalococcoidia bacterium]|nr:leucyl aminopeptidase [Dehalococcoidia bacterium]
MNIKVISGDIVKLKVDAIVVSFFEGAKSLDEAAGAVDNALDGVISNLIKKGSIKGKLNEVTLIHGLGKIAPEMVVVVGLGKKGEFNLEKVRGVASAACKSAREAGAERVATVLHGTGAKGLAPESLAQAITEGSLLGLYTFCQYVTKKPDRKEIEQITIVTPSRRNIAGLKAAVTKGTTLAQAAILARDLVNQPANFMTPTDLAEKAREVAEKEGLGIEILERDAMQKLGMGGLLGVAQGSQQPPKFVVLTYKGDPESQKVVGLVGKALTFDSGGISLKPADRMDEMKGDMAGGATVIAVMQSLGELKPKINVTGLIPSTENMPSGSALKPGDIIKAMNGKTIEVINTDAEGRLILADALCYGNKLGLSPMIDIATLTGACHVALGDVCSGAFGNNQRVIDSVIAAGERTGERMWQMPLFDEYKDHNKSDIADIKNSGGRWGGAISAAQFLHEFVGKTPWVHLDIAGTFMLDKGRGYSPKGATGIPVRTLVNWIEAMAEE